MVWTHPKSYPQGFWTCSCKQFSFIGITFLNKGKWTLCEFLCNRYYIFKKVECVGFTSEPDGHFQLPIVQHLYLHNLPSRGMCRSLNQVPNCLSRTEKQKRTTVTRWALFVGRGSPQVNQHLHSYHGKNPNLSWVACKHY